MKVLLTGSRGSLGSALGARLLAEGHEVVGIDLVGGQDIRDPGLVCQLFEDHNPDAVVHAAANKYVDRLELNPDEAITTNVFGTVNVVREARRHGVGRLLLVSTDKAQRPVGMLGYSKRAAEVYTLMSGYSAIRLVNVFGSVGSVAAIWGSQIDSGGPVTLTDPEMTRYFISIEKATDELYGALMGAQPWTLRQVSGSLFRMQDLAETLIRESGKDIGIVVTGARPGERVHEEVPVRSRNTTLMDGRDPDAWIKPLEANPTVESLLGLVGPGSHDYTMG